MSEVTKPKPIKRDYHAIIMPPGEAKVLLLQNEAGWQLLGWLTYERSEHEETEVRRKVGEMLGLATVNLMCYHFERRVEIEEGKPVPKQISKIFALESRNPSWILPERAAWISREELERLELAKPAQRAVLNEWLTEVETGEVPTLRVPWARPGWFERAVSWSNKEIAGRGWKINGPIEQIKANVISTVLRVPTEAGTLYLKAVPGYFKAEPVFSRLLTDLFSDKLPNLLATSVEEGLLLMADFGGKPLSEVDNLVQSGTAMAAYAQMQIEAVAAVENLLAAGVRDRRLAILGAQMEALFADSALLRGQPFIGLSETEVAQVQSLLPILKSLCDQLATYKVPETIDHGDFHDNNIAVTESGYIFYDWSDLTITHPFFSILMIYEWSSLSEAQRVPGWQAKIRDAYLQPWTIYEPMERLLEAFEIAAKLAIVVQLLNYKWISEQTEPKTDWEHDQSIPGFSRMLLKAFEIVPNEEEN